MVGLSVVDVQVVAPGLDRLAVSWKIDDVNVDIGSFLFSVHRSTSPGGPWDAVVDGLVDRWLYVDGDVDCRHRWRDWWYQVTATTADGSSTTTSAPTRLSAPPDLVATAVRTREQLIWRKFTGRQALLFPIRTFGQRCPCWDHILGKQLVRRCLTCFDTGFVGGYMHPMLVYVHIDPSAETVQMLDDGETQQVRVGCQCGHFPPVHPRDVLAGADGRRWRVTTVMPSERLQTVVSQQLELVGIQPGDIEYELPVDDDLFDQPADEHNFRRRHCL